MQVKVNGETVELEDGTSVQALLVHLEIPEPQGVAVAVNLDVIPRAERTSRALRDGDRIDVVTAVGGG